jgi:hypothetical protein
MIFQQITSLHRKGADMLILMAYFPAAGIDRMPAIASR